MISPTCASGEWAIDLAESYQLHQQCNGWIVTLEGLKRRKCVHHGMTFGGPGLPLPWPGTPRVSAWRRIIDALRKRG